MEFGCGGGFGSVLTPHFQPHVFAGALDGTFSAEVRLVSAASRAQHNVFARVLGFDDINGFFWCGEEIGFPQLPTLNTMYLLGP